MREEIETLHQLEQTIRNKIIKLSKEKGEKDIIVAWDVLTSLLPEYRLFKNMGVRPSSARGLLAEIMLRFLLEHWARERNVNYVYYGNLLIPRSDKGTTQLDGVFITSDFATVIESKSYQGKLTIKNGVIRSRTGQASPWKQNYGHIMSLKDVLGDKYKMYFHNLVYIFSEGVITDYTPAPEEFLMVNRIAMSSLDKISKNVNFRNQISQTDLNEIANILEEYIPTVEEEEEHINFVNSLIH